MLPEHSDKRPRYGFNFTIPYALAASIFLHLLIFVAVEAGYRMQWWTASFIHPRAGEAVLGEMARLLSQQREPPLLFIEVLPSQASPEPPPNAMYYSAHDARAAGSAPGDSPTPKIEGTQDLVPTTVERPREALPLQSAAPQAETAPAIPEPVLPQVQPPAAAPPGETAQAKASEAIPPKEAIQWDLSPVPQARERPRTLAAARQEEPRLYGERMKQEGGTRRLAAEASFDTKATPFGAYDQLIIEAIQKRWYDLLENRDYSRGRRGKVVVEFRLSSNGQISGMRVTENEVTELLALLCQRAIQEPAPYAPWPADMRRMLGSDTREVRFTFHYN